MTSIFSNNCLSFIIIIIPLEAIFKNERVFYQICCRLFLHPGAPAPWRGHRERCSSNLENECHEEDPIIVHEEGIVVEKSMPICFIIDVFTSLVFEPNMSSRLCLLDDDQAFWSEKANILDEVWALIRINLPWKIVPSNLII